MIHFQIIRAGEEKHELMRKNGNTVETSPRGQLWKEKEAFPLPHGAKHLITQQ